jgi:hypothetical protein
MFGFGKKKKAYFASKVLMTREALDRILVNGLSTKSFMVITFFPATRDELLKKVNDESANDLVISADKIINGNAVPHINSFLLTGGKQLVLAERYPLKTKEIQVAEKLEASGIPFPLDAYAALNDALLLQAGGEKIQSLMQKMGMTEDEIIAHSMIESSIEKFQEKIASKTNYDSTAKSAAEWFRQSLPFNG